MQKCKSSPAMQCHHIHAFDGILLKIFAITIFTWGSLSVETLFSLLLFDRSCRFPRCSNSSLSCRSLLSFKAKKWDETWTLISADDLMLHAKPLHWVPVNSSPKLFLHQLLRSTVRLQRSLAKMHMMDSLVSTTECRKSTKNSFQASCYRPLRAAKKQKKSPGLQCWLAGCEQGHLLLLLRRPSSRSLVLISIHPALRFFLRNL